LKTFSPFPAAATVVTGRIERGKVKVGEESEIVGFRETRKNGRDRRRNVQKAAG